MGVEVFKINNPSYKVFTGLLNQGGGSNPQVLIDTDNGNIVPGVTYTISNYQIGNDFTNVGAPSNANGVSFIATGTTATNWAGTTELNYDTGAPICTVLENTLGYVWFTYDSVGTYFINSIGLFTENKTTQFIGTGLDGVNNGILSGINYNDSNSMQFNTVVIKPIFNQIDGELYGTPIEIKVYN